MKNHCYNNYYNSEKDADMMKIVMRAIEVEANNLETSYKISETLLFTDKKNFLIFKKINKCFAFIVGIIPIICSIFLFVLPNLLVNLFCGFLIYSPYYIEKKFHIVILEEFRFMITFHTMLHSVFGKTLHFYDKYPLYDSFLHFLGGGLIALVVITVVLSSELHYSKHTKHGIKLKTDVFTFGFVNTAGVAWEILEFTGDLIFRGTPGYRLAQEDSLFDTMTDLIENNFGALFAIFVFWKFIKHNEKKGRDMMLLFKQVIPEPEKAY